MTWWQWTKRVWTGFCLFSALLFLSVFTLQGAPLDEWIACVILAALPWAGEFIWKRATS